jgi:hypothetical protein
MRARGTKTEKPGTTKSAPAGDDDDVALVKIKRRKGPLIKLHGPPAMGDKERREAAARGEDGVSGKGKKL